MKKLIVLMLVFNICNAYSQKKEFNRDFSIPEKTPFSLSYFGNIGINPGIKAGFEYSLYLKEKTKEKKRKIKTIRKNLILAPSISFYSHKDSHKGLLINGDLIWRRYTKRLYISDISIGLGYFRKFNSGITYEVTPSGVEEIGSSSRGYFSPSLGYSFGKRFTLKESIPTDIFLRSTYHIYLNQSASIGNDMSIELGIRMSLPFGINQGKFITKIKNKTK